MVNKSLPSQIKPPPGEIESPSVQILRSIDGNRNFWVIDPESYKSLQQTESTIQNCQSQPKQFAARTHIGTVYFKGYPVLNPVIGANPFKQLSDQNPTSEIDLQSEDHLVQMCEPIEASSEQTYLNPLFKQLSVSENSASQIIDSQDNSSIDIETDNLSLDNLPPEANVHDLLECLKLYRNLKSVTISSHLVHQLFIKLIQNFDDLYHLDIIVKP